MDAQTPDLAPDSLPKSPLALPSAISRLAPRARDALAGGHVRLGGNPQEGSVLAQAARVPWPRLSRRRGLHGPRQLGDLARGRFQIRLRAADGRAVVQRDGDRVAVAVHAAWRRRRARPRTGLPRFISALDLAAALAVGGTGDHRDRPRRSHRHRDRSQSAVSHSALDRRHSDRGGRVPDPGAASLRLSLDRSLRRGDAGRDRGLFCDPDRARRSRLGRGAARLRADLGHSRQPRDALSRARHSRRDRHAA